MKIAFHNRLSLHGHQTKVSLFNGYTFLILHTEIKKKLILNLN